MKIVKHGSVVTSQLRNGILAGLVLGTLGAADMVLAAGDEFGRAVPGKGAGAKTLLVYASHRTSYSLHDSMALLRLQLLRVQTRLESVPLADVTPKQMEGADYLVVFCPQANPELATNFLETVSQLQQPVLWVGFGADQLDGVPSFPWTFEISPAPVDRAAGLIQYREREWQAPVFPWITACLTASPGAKTVMSVLGASTNLPNAAQPLCWRMGNYTFFAGIPSGDNMSFLFSDMLLDFYQVKETPPAALFLRIEDYHAFSNHGEFLRMVDYLFSRHIPFMVGVVPAVRDPATGQTVALGSAPEFASALRYAQQRGGRLVLHGYHHLYGEESGEGREFWDAEQDRPLSEDSADYARDRVQNAARQMLRRGLFPLAWETPGYAASRKAYTAIAGVFSTAVERVQLSDATSQDKGVASGPTMDAYGRYVLPENMGCVWSGKTNAFDDIKAAGDLLTRLRGTIGGCYIHAYQPLDKLTGLVEVLEGYKLPWLDLADLDHAVVLPEKLLLTGTSFRTINLNTSTVTWKAYDRSGKLLSQQEEPNPSSGQRTFQRRGVGAYEVFEFVAKASSPDGK